MHTGTKYRLLCDSHSQPGTVLLAVTDDAGRAVGTASMVTGATWRLASLEASDITVAAALCHGIVQSIRVNRIRHVDVAGDVGARTWLATFGLTPSTTSVAAMLDEQRRTNPEGYQLVTKGYGLDEVEVPYHGELLTAPVVVPALAG
jgi:hypothetical protein